MGILTQAIDLAMAERAPTLRAELAASGQLRQFLREKEGEIQSQVVQGTMAMCARNGWDKLPFVEKAAHLNAARAMLTESALAEALEFPPEGTSSPSRG